MFISLSLFFFFFFAFLTFSSEHFLSLASFDLILTSHSPFFLPFLPLLLSIATHCELVSTSASDTLHAVAVGLGFGVATYCKK